MGFVDPEPIGRCNHSGLGRKVIGKAWRGAMKHNPKNLQAPWSLVPCLQAEDC